MVDVLKFFYNEKKNSIKKLMIGFKDVLPYIAKMYTPKIYISRLNFLRGGYRLKSKLAMP